MKRAVVFLLALGMAPAHAAFVGFDAPGGGTHGGDGTYAYGVNSQGMVVGTVVNSSGGGTGYLRAPDGTITTFNGMNDGADTHAIDINENGTVVGYYRGIDDHYHGFTMTSDFTLTTFDPRKSMNTQAIAINDRNDIAGQYLKRKGPQLGFLALVHGRDAHFGAGPVDGFGAFVTGINNAKTVVGFWFDGQSAMHGYLRTNDGTVTQIDVDGAGTGAVQGTQAESINANGEVAGFDTDGDGKRHGFVRAVDGTITAFDVPGAVNTVVAGINRRGYVAGYYVDASSIAHGFVRTPKGNFKTFDAPGAALQSGRGTFVSRIGDDGTIVGEASDAAFILHGFVGTP